MATRLLTGTLARTVAMASRFLLVAVGSAGPVASPGGGAATQQGGATPVAARKGVGVSMTICGVGLSFRCLY